MANDPQRNNEERVTPQRSPSGDRSAERGDKGSFGGDQPLRDDDRGNDLDVNREPRRDQDREITE